MKAVVQRVQKASVTVDGSKISQIGQGLAVLLGVGKGDSDTDAIKLADKIANLRIFEDEQGKMNLSLLDTGGQALVVSQFTLYADCRKGRRPGFDQAAPHDEADKLYQKFVEYLQNLGVPVQTGQFQAKMLFEIQNDGPVTILLDSAELARG
ncbi:MAG TPA: D-aminoacyl-tRNA deacylase [Armatimonadota bacterium]|nr:D-aminoacyl-tRNA deacylase [Armatimonadota bacterium]HOP79072.1 D-aminoacyl-tRNA deacylase [Armatimonadota bacterium]